MDESYTLTQLDDQVYDEATSTAPTYSSLGPGYDVAAYKREEIDTYDVPDQKQKKTNIPEPTADPEPVRDKVSKKGDDFYDAEDHTYSVVNVKNKKKTKKGCHGDQQMKNIKCNTGAGTTDDNRHMKSKPQDKSVRDEASKKGDDFYDAEEHTYSVVNVKNKKKAKRGRHGDQQMNNTPGVGTCEVIDSNQHKTSKPQDKSVRDEASKRRDDFYDAEEHTYSVVNKKKAKKTSEDGEGERGTTR